MKTQQMRALCSTLFGVLAVLMVTANCGVQEFFGTRQEPLTSPCVELVPTPTATSRPTATPLPTVTPTTLPTALPFITPLRPASTPNRPTPRPQGTAIIVAGEPVATMIPMLAPPTETPALTPVAPTSTPTVTPTPTPYTCVVTTAADDTTTPPFGSLRQILAQATCCTSITFVNTVGTITLGGAGLAVPATCTNLTIDGSGGNGGQVTISGNNASKVLYVSNGATVILNDLTIRDGQDNVGAGIFNWGDLTINSTTTVSNNTAGSTGGGIYNRGILTMAGTVAFNTAGYYGGGLENTGTLTVSGTINNNYANQHGGGIFNYGDCTITSSGVITNNTAVNIGGGIVHNTGTLTMNGTVSWNTTQGGGGIANYAMMTVGGVVRNNKASFGGGGILVACGSATLNGSVLDNQSNDWGGGIMMEPTGGCSMSLQLNSGHLIQGNYANYNNDSTGIGGGLYLNVGATVTGTADYGSDNYQRSDALQTIDNCFASGATCPPFIP